MSAPPDIRAPDADVIITLVERAAQTLPEPYRAILAEVPVRVQDWPDEETLRDQDIDDALELTGLYRGVPLGDRLGLNAPPSEPPMILLYRLPILFEWAQSGRALHELVFDVLTHELGHHLNMDEEAALRLEGREL